MTQLALVIDLNVCVGCHACVTSCKEGNTSGSAWPPAALHPYSQEPESIGSKGIREGAGYALMPEWGTRPANHYLPRRKTERRIHADELTRADNPLKVDGLLPKPPPSDPSLDDVTSW